ncbi:hypothetical protein AVEN_235644-1 [Araneus ventricosus]|uniref:HTH psq-type domain-containing protein n=1 Tax=Araneus ventricosus TaxID=182803 RepID=A0A4Y2BQS5_ARAVE|nr:hypothetical protein AVEN_235644-1 [Araneus ventricosus]
MSDVKRKRNVLNVKQKLEILQKLDYGESSCTDAEDLLNEGNTISHCAALQSVETLLDYMGQRVFDYGDNTAIRKICVDIRQEMNKQQSLSLSLMEFTGAKTILTNSRSKDSLQIFFRQQILKGKFLV